MKKKFVHMYPAYHDGPNDVDPWNVTLWGTEVLMALEENYLSPMFVNRDYGSAIQAYGETVNARIKQKMHAKRKNYNNPVKVQRLQGSTVPVKLDQLWHTSYVVDDWGSTRVFGSIIDEYLLPAARSLAQFINASLLAQAVHFIDRRAGALGGITPSNAVSSLASFNGAMNEGQDWGGAPLFIDNETRTTLLNVEQFQKVNEHGDNEVLRRAYLGTKFDLDLLKSSDVAGNRARAPINSTTTTASAARGTSVIAVTAATGISAGRRISVAGKPYKVASVASLNVTIVGALLEDVASGAQVLAFGETDIDTSATYKAGHAEAVGFTAAVAKGDVVDIEHDGGGFGTYVVIQNDDGDLLLDRPLEDEVSDENDVFFWPGGAYNFGFSENAILMVARSLPAVPAGLGADSAVVQFNGLPLRITRTYEGRDQQVLITFDILGGFKPVMKNEGGVMLT